MKRVGSTYDQKKQKQAKIKMTNPRNLKSENAAKQKTQARRKLPWCVMHAECGAYFSLTGGISKKVK